MTFNGNWGRQSPVGGGVTQLPSVERRSHELGRRDPGASQRLLRAHPQRDVGRASTSRATTAIRTWICPSGRVRVNSVFEDGASGVQTLTFGGNQGLSSSSRSFGGTLQNNLSWFDNANKHRIKLTTELQLLDEHAGLQASNLLGTFFFNSLADLEAGRPASFSRDADRARARRRVSSTGALAHWRLVPPDAGPAVPVRRAPRCEPLHDDAGVQSGGRGDVRRGATIGCPTPFSISPRIGFSWTLGRGAGDRRVLRRGARAARGGSRRHRRVLERDERGADRRRARQHRAAERRAADLRAWGRRCRSRTGTRTPAIRRASRIAAPTARPARCSRTPSPNVTLFAVRLPPQRAVRSNLSWNGSVLDARFSTEHRRHVFAEPEPAALAGPELRARRAIRAGRRDGRPVFVRADEHRADDRRDRVARCARVAGVLARVGAALGSRVAHGAAQLPPVADPARPDEVRLERRATRTRTSASRCRASAARPATRSASTGRARGRGRTRSTTTCATTSSTRCR